MLGYGYGCKRRPRRHASSAQPSVVIAENGAVEVQVSVAEDVFTGIKVGDTASVTVSAVSKEPMNGTVSTLPAAANVQTNPV